MQEIAQQFKEELQELLDRYKTRLSVQNIMHVAHDVFHKTLSIKYHPELHNLTEDHLKQIMSSGPSFLEKHALHDIPTWIAEQMTESERAAFAKWYNKVRSEIEANKLGDTLKNG